MYVYFKNICMFIKYMYVELLTLQASAALSCATKHRVS